MSLLATLVWAQIACVPSPIIFGGFRNKDEVRTAGALHLHQMWAVWSHGRIRRNLVSRIGSFRPPASPVRSSDRSPIGILPRTRAADAQTRWY